MEWRVQAALKTIMQPQLLTRPLAGRHLQGPRLPPRY